MFALVVTVCLNLDASTCSAIVFKDPFITPESCREFAEQDYPNLLAMFPIVTAMQCLRIPGETA